MSIAALGQFIKAERERQRLTLRQLEKLSGVSSSMISKIENDYIKSLSMETLDGIADGLRLDRDMLARIARGESPEPTEPKLPMMNDEEARAFVEMLTTLSPEAKKEALAHLLYLKHRDEQAKKQT